MSLPSSLPNLGKTSRGKFCFLSGIARKRGGEAQWANLDKSESIQFYQTNVTNVTKILLLQVFLNIRRKLFDFQTFMNQTYIINSTDIIIYFTDTYYLYYGGGQGTPNSAKLNNPLVGIVKSTQISLDICALVKNRHVSFSAVPL